MVTKWLSRKIGSLISALTWAQLWLDVVVDPPAQEELEDDEPSMGWGGSPVTVSQESLQMAQEGRRASFASAFDPEPAPRATGPLQGSLAARIASSRGAR